MPERTARQAEETGERRDAQLFVHLRLETVGQAPLLAGEDVAQAACTALRSRARMLRCHIRAIGGDPCHLHVLFQFPASLSLRHLVEMARDSSAQAVALALSLERGERVAPEDIWGGSHQLNTLSHGDVTAATAYVRLHAGPDVPCQRTWSDFLREEGARYSGTPG